MQTSTLFYLYSDSLGYMVVLISGLCVGSFLNVVIYRLPKMLQRQWQQEYAYLERNITLQSNAQPYNLLFPRSSCPYCQKVITAKYNIPVFSWLYLRGNSRCCNNKISIRYLCVEVLTAVMTLVVAYNFPSIWFLSGALLLIWALIVLAFIDIDTRILPDKITLPLLWGGLLFNLHGSFVPLHAAVMGAFFGYMLLWVIMYWIFKWVSHKEGIGYGDLKLMAALGAWFGGEAIPILLLLASMSGTIFYVGAWLFKKQTPHSVAFGPYLAFSGSLLLLSHSDLANFFTLPL